MRSWYPRSIVVMVFVAPSLALANPPGFCPDMNTSKKVLQRLGCDSPDDPATETNNVSPQILDDEMNQVFSRYTENLTDSENVALDSDEQLLAHMGSKLTAIKIAAGKETVFEGGETKSKKKAANPYSEDRPEEQYEFETPLSEK